MPLTDKGQEIMSHMKKEYGAKEGESVFYASKNKGKISGVDSVEKLKKATERVDSLHKRMDAVVVSRQDSKTMDSITLYNMVRNIDSMGLEDLKRLHKQEMPDDTDVYKNPRSLRTMLKSVLQSRAGAIAKRRATAGRIAG